MTYILIVHYKEINNVGLKKIVTVLILFFLLSDHKDTCAILQALHREDDSLSFSCSIVS